VKDDKQPKSRILRKKMFSEKGEVRGIAAAVLVAAVALGLDGCSSINRSEGFAGDSNQSFLMVAADGMPITGSRSYTFVLQKVDLQTSTFLEEGVWIDFASLGPVAGNEFEKPRQLITTTRFGGEVASPGDYALISRIDNVSLGATTNTNWNCFNKAAPVFHVTERQIAIVAAGNVMTAEPLDSELAERQAKQIIASYPKYIAPAAVAKITGLLAFDSGTSILGRPTCNPRGRFRFSGPGSVGGVVP